MFLLPPVTKTPQCPRDPDSDGMSTPATTPHPVEFHERYMRSREREGKWRKKATFPFYQSRNTAHQKSIVLHLNKLSILDKKFFLLFSEMKDEFQRKFSELVDTHLSDLKEGRPHDPVCDLYHQLTASS